MVALYTQSLPNIKNLTRKIELCKHLLEVFKVVEPGISRLQGYYLRSTVFYAFIYIFLLWVVSAVTMYEQQSTEVLLAQKRYSFKEISKDDYVSSLLSAEVMLKQAVKWLLYEPFKSPEGRLAQRAMGELKDLRKLVTQAQSSDKDKAAKNKMKGGKH